MRTENTITNWCRSIGKVLSLYGTSVYNDTSRLVGYNIYSMFLRDDTLVYTISWQSNELTSVKILLVIESNDNTAIILRNKNRRMHSISGGRNSRGYYFCSAMTCIELTPNSHSSSTGSLPPVSSSFVVLFSLSVIYFSFRRIFIEHEPVR